MEFDYWILTILEADVLTSSPPVVILGISEVEYVVCLGLNWALLFLLVIKRWLIRAQAVVRFVVGTCIPDRSREAEAAEPAMRLDGLLILSPHLDDAVFSCAHLLSRNPGAVVATIYAGIPPDGTTSSDWDRICGFSSARQAMVERRLEDRKALDLLGAEHCWLGALDFPYRNAGDAADIAPLLARTVRRYRPRYVALPLALVHEDHRLTHLAALWLARRMPQVQWLVYQDAIYDAVIGLKERRLAAVERANGIRLRAWNGPVTGDEKLKSRAAQCYKSQLRGLATTGWLGAQGLMPRPEHYWSI